MAIDVYSENIVDILSPRLSFSNDLQDDETTNNDDNKIELNFTDSAFDFAFNVDSTISFQSSTADELFSNGKILPTSLKKDDKEEEIREESIKTPNLMPCLDPHQPEARKKSLKEFLEDSIEEEEEKEPNSIARSFWKFRRSNSLNCDRNQRKGLMKSWKILSRSGSTGKYLEKIVEDEEETYKSSRKSFWKFSRNNSINSEPLNSNHHHQSKGINQSFRRSSSLNCETRKGLNQYLPRSYSSGYAPKKEQNFVHIRASSCQKKQVKSNFYGYGNNINNNYMRVSPSVLNLPPPYISRVSVDLFGFGMLFCNGKDRKKKK